MICVVRWMLLLCCVSGLAQAEADHAYLADLQAQARAMQLAERPEWRKLLHYVPRTFSAAYVGQVDSPAFYLAAQGKTDPQAELDATLAGFYSDVLETDTQQNPQCAFIARYTWLNSQLHFSPEQLPPRRCQRYEQWHATLNPGGLTLVFASAYLNSPSSMYGHTLLRVDGQDQDEQTRLLAYSVSFAASTTETNGLAFAVNGLFGGYAGEFTILPYYAKVREYSDFENRDIWEYPLNLSRAEIDRVLMHAWELGPQYFDYFFFDENCAYHLLGLLQVARPEFEFTRQFPHWAIPADTLRGITAQPGLTGRPVYRPAAATLLRNRLVVMSDAERQLVHGISRGEISLNDAALQQLPVAQAATVLETSLDYVNYRRATGNHDVAAPALLAQDIQRARSRQDVIAPPLDKHEPATKPDQGHGSSRVTAGAGQRAGQTFEEVQLRATYHDLMDSDAGYVRGAEIDFFNTTVRHYQGVPTRVERLLPVSILSLAPRDEFFHAPSWKVSAGWRRVRAGNGREPLALGIDGGIGAAWTDAQQRSLSYVFLDGSSVVNAGLTGGYAVGVGASAGSYLDVNEFWRIHPYVKSMRYLAGQQDSVASVGGEQRWVLVRDVAVRVDVALKRELQKISNTWLAALQVYF